jgi:hypothetical protein
MPFKYKTKGKRQEISKDVIEKAIAEIKTGAKIKPTAIKFNIPRSSLQRYLKMGEVIKIFPNKFTSTQIFSIEEETKMEEYIKISSKLNYGLSKLEARKLAYGYAVALNKHLPENWVNNNIASKDWLQGFLCRHPELSVRTPEATSLTRATSFNRTNVEAFFGNLKDIFERFNFGPESIYNIDESGLTTTQKTQKIIAVKGTKQVGQMTSAERGTLVTICCGANAIGNVIPPFFIFPRVNFKSYMLNGAPIGSAGAAHPSGWMTSENFYKYMEHFSKFAKPTTESPVLILMDNHESHISVPTLNFCKENGIVLLTFPPHCSHKLQPLDLSVYGPLKNYYNIAVTDWLTSNGGSTMTIYEIPKLAAIAMPQAFKSQNIISGFEKSGIWPFNSNIFSDEDFLCSFVTDRPLSNSSDNETVAMNALTTEKINDLSASICEAVSPEVVRPYPKAGPRKNTRKPRKSGKTRILTDTPEKNQIEKEFEEKQSKLKKKMEQKNKKLPSMKIKQITRNITDPIPSTSKEHIITNKKINIISDITFVQCTKCKKYDEKKNLLKCVNCKAYCHGVCVSRSYKNNIDSDSSDEDNLYVCEICFKLGNDSDSINSEELFELANDKKK